MLTIKKLREMHARDMAIFPQKVYRDENAKKKSDFVSTETPKKLEVDPVKLEESIKKAIRPIQKKGVVVLKDVPKAAAKPAPTVTVVSMCAARNLNGTPCKCKAKVGKFCTKHAP